MKSQSTTALDDSKIVSKLIGRFDQNLDLNAAKDMESPKEEEHEILIDEKPILNAWQSLWQYLTLSGISVTALGFTLCLLAFALPRFVNQLFLYPVFRCFFVILYPTFQSYEAVTPLTESGIKFHKFQVKWTIYWIVFAFVTSIESLTDAALFWLPLYYELKMIFYVLLMSPITNGFVILFARVIHPALEKRQEQLKFFRNKPLPKDEKNLNGIYSKALFHVSQIAQNISREMTPALLNITTTVEDADFSKPPSNESTPRTCRKKTISMCPLAACPHSPEIDFWYSSFDASSENEKPSSSP